MNVREIAKLAGVSIATVSRVVNRPDIVLPETREHVLKVMREHNYNPAARSAKEEYIRAVALLVNNGGTYLSRRLMEGIESVAARRNHVVILCNTHGDPQKLQGLTRSTIIQHLAGIVATPAALCPDDVARLHEARLPLVLVGGTEAARQSNTCSINYEEGAYRMARHLLALGHRNIALLCIEDAPSLAADMQNGLLRALTAAKIDQCPLRIIRAESSVAGGWGAAGALLEPEPPDAVFCASDDMALGLMDALRERGLRLPQDIAVTGFSGSPIAGVVTPRLTTVEQPSYKLGMVAARMLFDLIDDGVSDAVPHNIVLTPKLKIRSSCGGRKPADIPQK